MNKEQENQWDQFDYDRRVAEMSPTSSNISPLSVPRPVSFGHNLPELLVGEEWTYPPGKMTSVVKYTPTTLKKNKILPRGTTLAPRDNNLVLGMCKDIFDVIVWFVILPFAKEVNLVPDFKVRDSAAATREIDHTRNKKKNMILSYITPLGIVPFIQLMDALHNLALLSKDWHKAMSHIVSSVPLQLWIPDFCENFFKSCSLEDFMLTAAECCVGTELWHQYEPFPNLAMFLHIIFLFKEAHHLPNLVHPMGNQVNLLNHPRHLPCRYIWWLWDFENQEVFITDTTDCCREISSYNKKARARFDFKYNSNRFIPPVMMDKWLIPRSVMNPDTCSKNVIFHYYNTQTRRAMEMIINSAKNIKNSHLQTRVSEGVEVYDDVSDDTDTDEEELVNFRIDLMTKYCSESPPRVTFTE